MNFLSFENHVGEKKIETFNIFVKKMKEKYFTFIIKIVQRSRKKTSEDKTKNSKVNHRLFQIYMNSVITIDVCGFLMNLAVSHQ